MKKEPLVSVIIPTRNSAETLEACLKSIKEQTYKNIETLLIDGNSSDDTTLIIKKYNAKLIPYNPIVEIGIFDAPFRRNYGVTQALGKYVYYVDADMELEPHLIDEAVQLCENTKDALIIPEESFGIGIWAQAKKLERQCYFGDDNVEAPRFFKKEVWEKLGGLDEDIGGGGDDWELYQKLKEHNYKVGRTKNIIYHNEGNLSLIKLMKKRFMYGRETLKYLKKRPAAASKSYFPLRTSYFKNWKLFVKNPLISIFFIIMRSFEYASGLAGIIYSLIKKNE
jgi:glycosyltransferase involved in cell wall biosynthesis